MRGRNNVDSNRRTLLACLGTAWLLPLSRAALAGTEPVVAGISRIELKVSNLATSMTFYGRLFGNAGWQRSSDGRAWLPLGTSTLVLEEATVAAQARSVFAVTDFDAALLQGYLAAQNLHADLDGEGLLVLQDGDGITTALKDLRASPPLLAPAVVQGGNEAPLFAALQVDEVHLAVSNLEVDALFYSRLLGRTASQVAGSLWYELGQGRLRLSQTPPGQQAGANYFAVLVANTDMEAAGERVFAAGGLVENFLPNGFSFWDPDGLRVLVRSTIQH
jgi:predicted enzyme related to lactoylglutathione lyase